MSKRIKAKNSWLRRNFQKNRHNTRIPTKNMSSLLLPSRARTNRRKILAALLFFSSFVDDASIRAFSLFARTNREDISIAKNSTNSSDPSSSSSPKEEEKKTFQRAEIDATTSFIAKKAREFEQTLKLFERQRMDLYPPEETPSFVRFERRPRRVLGDFNSSDWKQGRATWYGGPQGPGPDGMSIYTGSCGYGKDLGNHFVTAVQTDGGYDYGLTEECGKCIEVVCVNGPTRGFEWSELGKWAGCQEPAVKSVVVKITDSCPCNHPNEGNKRWCCGDREHLDLSYAAFDQIAIRHRGVVDLKFRPASCKDQGKVVSYY